MRAPPPRLLPSFSPPVCSDFLHFPMMARTGSGGSGSQPGTTKPWRAATRSTTTTSPSSRRRYVRTDGTWSPGGLLGLDGGGEAFHLESAGPTGRGIKGRRLVLCRVIRFDRLIRLPRASARARGMEGGLRPVVSMRHPCPPNTAHTPHHDNPPTHRAGCTRSSTRSRPPTATG